MVSFFLSSLAILGWIATGALLRTLVFRYTSDAFSVRFSRCFTTVIIFAVVPYYMGTLIWQNGIPATDGTVIGIIVLAMLGVGYFLSRAVAPSVGISVREAYLPLTVMNTLYLGVPVTQFFVGRSAVHYTIIYSVLITVVQFAVVVPVIAPRAGLRFALSPMVWLSAGGWILWLRSVNPPAAVIAAKDAVGLVISPLMLAFIGFSLPPASLVHRAWMHVGITVFCRIITGLTVTAVLLALVKRFMIPTMDDGLIRSVLFVSALPSAIVNFVIHEAVGLDTRFTAGQLVWGTLVTVLALPFIGEVVDILSVWLG
jgi:predicted permease